MSIDSNAAQGQRNLSFLVPGDQVALEFAELVKFMRQDADRHVFRRFEKLSLFNLLSLQRQLADYDDLLTIHENNWDGQKLDTLIPELEPLLKRYYEALMLQAQIEKLKPVPPHLVSWLMDYARQSLRALAHEFDPGSGWSDLLHLSNSDKGSIYRFVEKRSYLSSIFKINTPPDTSGFYTYSGNAVLVAERTIINGIFCILIIIPLFILTFVANKWLKTSLVVVCMLLVSPVISVLADRTQNAGLGVMAGYTAILAVFLSSDST